MNIRPASKEDLAQALRAAHRPGARLGPTDLSGLNRLLQHAPEDMTAKVETGLTLAALQEALARRGQWLPIDPPAPERLTVARLLSENLSGPRRFGFGTIRDYLIGLQVALADGRLVSSGGNVVKNVAGYDLLKLFVGAKDSLGIPVEATFKLLPLPETELFVQTARATPEQAEELTASILESELTPIVLDWHRVGPDAVQDGAVRLVLGFAGTREQVEWQRERAGEAGFTDPADLSYEREFWSLHAATAVRQSVLPSLLSRAIRDLGSKPFIARAGNGVLYFPADGVPPILRAPDALSLRVKECFDPNRMLPAIPT